MFHLSAEPINAEPLKQLLANPQAGALTTFEGWVRNHNEGLAVKQLEYESYEALAKSEAEKIISEAKEKFAIVDASCVHRVGSLAIGELAVWVGVTAHHRGPAFDACQYIIDEIKSRVPIWKKEHYVDGNSGWVNCYHTHDSHPVGAGSPRPHHDE